MRFAGAAGVTPGGSFSLLPLSTAATQPGDPLKHAVSMSG